MALVGYEPIILVAIVLVIILWDPQKLLEFARSLGLAKREFDKSAKEIMEHGSHEVTKN